jgi:hypothetical protein
MFLAEQQLNKLVAVKCTKQPNVYKFFNFILFTVFHCLLAQCTLMLRLLGLSNCKYTSCSYTLGFSPHFLGLYNPKEIFRQMFQTKLQFFFFLIYRLVITCLGGFNLYFNCRINSCVLV